MFHVKLTWHLIMAIFVRILNPAIMILLALGLGTYIAKKFRTDWGLYWIGVLTFIGSQVIHIPFNQWLLSPLLNQTRIFLNQGVLSTIVMGIMLGLSAGFFEESARYLVYYRWLKTNRTWNSGLMFGAGHGGVEALLIGILSLFTTLRLTALRGVDLSTLVAPEQLSLAQAQIAAFWAAPWYTILLGAVERAAALCLHLSLSILVLQAFFHSKIRWLFIAMLYHTLVDAVAVIGVINWGIFITEAIIVAFGIFSLWIVKRMKSYQIIEPETPLPIPEMIPLEPRDITIEQIEKSRYEQ